MAAGGSDSEVLAAEDVIRSKVAAGRPKDIYHLEVLRQVLALRNALADDDPTRR